MTVYKGALFAIEEVLIYTTQLFIESTLLVRMRHRTKTNLSRAARSRGGRRSAAIQTRDHGRFAGKSAVMEVWDDMNPTH